MGLLHVLDHHSSRSLPLPAGAVVSLLLYLPFLSHPRAAALIVLYVALRTQLFFALSLLSPNGINSPTNRIMSSDFFY